MKKKIPLIIIKSIILAGIIMLFVAGFEKSVNYKAGTRIEVYIPKGYEGQDILAIAKESFIGKKIALEKVEKLVQIAGININEKYSEEEMNNFKSKISEKYGIEEKELEIYEVSLPKVRVSTDIKPYVYPITLVTILSLIYVLFRNIKNENKWRIILKIVITLAVVLGVYFSLILITRVPYGAYTMPIALAIYIITLLISVNNKSK